jgi:uncharacterized protein (TIGR03437 family)
MKALLSVSLSVLLLSASILAQEPLEQIAQPAAQYRGFWVDTFNTPLNNHNDVLAVVSHTKLAHCNAIFMQVRRRGDSWYRNSLEPLADRTPIEAGFDPLADLIAEAHAQGIEVHAFVIIGAIWNGNPTGATPRPPESPQHVFNQHGFNQTTGKLYEGRDNWLTRSLLTNDGNITFDGHRFGNDFWLDLGHPDAAQYSFDVLLHLVRNYDLDGLHLDRIRYPEVAATLNGGANIGYNAVSVARFQTRYGIAEGAPPPASNDARWQQWRREQVTSFVRRVYLNAIALKPRLKVSAALIAFGGGPTTEAGWLSAEAYWRVFQDWRAWTEEGILDLAIPMNYKREHTASQVPLLDTWAEWTKNHAYDRMTLHGLGVYLNSIEGTLRQIRKAAAPSGQGRRSDGVVFFSFAVTNEAVTANPLSIPPNQDTPRRAFAEFAAGLTTGKSVDGMRPYEDQMANPVAVFAQPAPVPALPWKVQPQTGHLMGVISNGAITPNPPHDSASVTITRVADGTAPTKGRWQVRTQTDGNGFYGAVDLAPGRYVVNVTPVNGRLYWGPSVVEVTPGAVAQLNLITQQPQPPTFAPAVVAVSAASFHDSAVAAESVVACFGEALSDATVSASQLPLPNVLNGVRVRLLDLPGGSVEAPLFFVSPSQVNFLVPPQVNASNPHFGLVRFQVIRNSSVVAQGILNLDRVAPGLFAANANGAGVAAALALRVRADGSQSLEPVAQFDATQQRFVPRALETGTADEQFFLILFGTGLRGHTGLSNVQARLGGQAVEVLFAGAQGDLAGLDQINLRVPRAVLQALAGRGAVDVLLTVDGRTANPVQLAIK